MSFFQKTSPLKGSGLGMPPKVFVAATRGRGTSWREILWQS